MKRIQETKGQRLVQLSGKRIVSFVALGSLAALAGCGQAPSLNIIGSFFPAWLICMIIGIVLALIVSQVLAHFKLNRLIAWPVFVYPCFAATVAFTLWLFFF
jgi:hypothetical protein